MRASRRRWLWTQALKDEEEFVVSIGQNEGGQKEGPHRRRREGERGERGAQGLTPRSPGESALRWVPHLLGSGFQPPRSLLVCAGFDASARLPVGFRNPADSACGRGIPTRSERATRRGASFPAPSRREAATTEGKG